MSDLRIRALLVEDNPGDARLIKETLAEAGAAIDLETVDRLAASLERLRRGGVDVLLLDLGLPDSQGRATFTAALAQAPHVPIIVFTGLGDEALATRLAAEGAQDYLVKGQVDGAGLARAIRYAIERHRVRAENRRLNRELEARVVERTRQLEATNQELESFTYSVSHDLRAPLRHIDGFARLLEEHLGPEIDEKAGHFVRRIREGAAHMARLVDDLLNLARVGRLDVQAKATPLAGVVQGVLADLRPELEGRGVDWHVGDLPTVQCDPGLMKILFTNLLSNAVKYTRSRSPAVIEVAHRSDGGRAVVFVRDNGVGFDMKYADKLFGVFQRLHRPEDFEGTGVGLATVQRIVRKHGGEVWAEAEPDKGATFYFTLGAAPRGAA